MVADRNLLNVAIMVAALALVGASVNSRELADGKQAVSQAIGLRAAASTDGQASCTCVAPPKPGLVAPIPVSPPNLVPENRGTLVASAWSSMPGWGRDNPADAWQGFLKSCNQLRGQTPWQSVCGLALALPANASSGVLIKFFEDNFIPHQVVNPDGSNSGTITGYYEPLLTGSRIQTVRYSYPLYKVPEDLIVVDLGDVYPELKNKRLRGRLEGNRVVPYFDRGGIDTATKPLKSKELVWVEYEIEAFFLHIQGSGRVQFEDGTSMRVGYADQNGHPFRSLGRLLIDKGEMTLAQTSMQGITGSPTR